MDDATSTTEEIAVSIPVLTNDSDPDGDSLTTTTIFNGPSNGMATIVNGDSILYTPDPNFTGNDTLHYVITDPGGLMDTAQVVITVNPGDRLEPLPEGNVYPGFVFASGDSPAGVEASLREARDCIHLRFED